MVFSLDTEKLKQTYNQVGGCFDDVKGVLSKYPLLIEACMKLSREELIKEIKDLKLAWDFSTEYTVEGKMDKNLEDFSNNLLDRFINLVEGGNEK